MADLSARLPTETDSAQRFIQAPPATPSIWTSIANFGSGVASVGTKVMTALDQASNSRRLAETQNAQNNAAKDVVSFLSQPGVGPQVPPGSEAAAANSAPLAQQAAASQTAASQGKIDPSMAQAKGLAALRQALAQNPGHEFAVYQVFKDAGVTNMVMQQYANAEKSLESDADNQQAILHKQQDDAVNKYGYTNFFQQSPADQAKILATVGNLNAQEADLEAKTKAASLAVQNSQLTKDQADQLKTQNSTSLLQSATTYMTGSFSNANKVLLNILADPALANQPGRVEQLQSHLMNVAIPAMDAQFNQRMAQIAPYLTPTDNDTLTKLYQSQRQSLVEAVSGPTSIVQMNQRILTNISDTYGINYAQAAPTLMRLQKMIGPQAIGVLLSPSIQGNKPLMDMLANELKGAIQDPSKLPSFTEHVQVLNGSIDNSTWDPQKIAASAPAMLSSMNSLAHNDPSINGTDKQGHQALVNSIKNTAGIAVDVVPQWGFGNVLMQGKALNTRGVTTALFNTQANAGDRMDAIHAWIPATTRTYETLANMKSSDQFYSAQLDPHTLTWKAVWNGQMQSADGYTGGANVLSVRSGMQFQQSKPAPSTAVLEQVSTLNHMLNNLSDAGSKGYDDTLGKGISYQDARRYFANGEIPAKLQKPASQKNGKTPEQNVDDAISHMLDFVNTLPTPGTETTSGKGPSPALPDKTAMDKYYADEGGSALANYQKYAPVVAQSAQAHGVPIGVAMNLIHTESKFNPNADSGEAHGLGQISYKTAAGMGLDLHSLTPEQNVDNAMAILADNYKKTGNWKDAASMYLTGRTIAKAGNAADKNGTTAPVYAAAVVPSTVDNWLGSNMPIGQETAYGVRY